MTLNRNIGQTILSLCGLSLILLLLLPVSVKAEEYKENDVISVKAGAKKRVELPARSDEEGGVEYDDTSDIPARGLYIQFSTNQEANVSIKLDGDGVGAVKGTGDIDINYECTMQIDKTFKCSVTAGDHKIFIEEWNPTHGFVVDVKIVMDPANADAYTGNSSGLSNSGKDIKLAVGKEKNLTKDITGDTSLAKFTWSSKNKKIAKVDKQGYVEGIHLGCTTITAKDNNSGEELEWKIVVNSQTIDADYDDLFFIGKQYSLKSYAKYLSSPKWKSISNAKVSGQKIKAKKEGSVSIRCKAGKNTYNIKFYAYKKVKSKSDLDKFMKKYMKRAFSTTTGTAVLEKADSVKKSGKTLYPYRIINYHVGGGKTTYFYYMRIAGGEAIIHERKVS